MEEKSKNNDKKVIFIFSGMFLVGMAIILAIIFWLNGETKTTGNFPNPESTTSLSCESVGYSYPFFTYDNADKRTTTINATFNNEELSSVSLIYLLKYNDNALVIESEAENHAAMNGNFAKENLEADAFESSYSRLSDSLKYNIYAKSDAIYNGGAAKYFLLDTEMDKPFMLDDIKYHYQQKGFKCEQNN